MVFDGTFNNIKSVGSSFDVNSFRITQILKYFTTEVVSSSPVHGEVYSIQHYVMKLVGVLWQVSGFLRVLGFPLTAGGIFFPEIIATW
jgi:hypothetical protein